MKHLLVLAAFLALSAATAIPRFTTPQQCFVEWDHDGQCMSGQQTWTYDHTSLICKAIDKYGCVGSGNVFKTEEECLLTCAPIERKAEAAIIHSDLKVDIFKFNSFVDKVFGKISSGMKSLGADPIEVGGFVLDQIPNLKLGFKDGSLSGLSNIVRVGDWGFDMEGVTRYAVHGGVGIHDVKGQFTAVGELAGHGGEVTVTTTMNKFDVTFSFYADLKKCTIGLDKFTLGDGLELTIDIDSGSFLDPVKSETITSATNYLLTTFNEVVEKATLVALGSVNVCELVASMVALG